MVASLAGAGSAHAAEQNAYAAAMTYLTPAVSVGQGDSLTFHNLDNVAKHDLVGHDGSFGSPLIGGGQSAKVEGVEQLGPGTYDFHCTLHNWMQGKLTVGSAGPGSGTPEIGGGGGSVSTGSSAPDPRDIWPQASKRPLGPGNWPMYGHDLSNSRNGGASGPSVNDAMNLGAVWSFHSADGDFTGTPVVKKGVLVAAGGGGTVYALDAATGEPRWQRDLITDEEEGKNTSINASASIHKGRVYIPVVEVGGPRLVALKLKTGKVLFDTRIGDQPKMDTYGSPTVVGKRVFIGTSGYFGELSSDTTARGTVVAVHRKTGKLLWRTFTVPEGHDGGSVWSTPAFDRRRKKLYVGSGNAYHEPAADTTDSMLQIDPKTGRIVRHFQATPGDAWNGPDDSLENPDADFGASPNLITAPDGRALIGQGQKSGRYWAVDRDTMEPVWNAITGPGSFSGGIVGSTAFDENGIYGPDTHLGESWALTRAGQNKWVSADGGPLHFNATSVANGVVYTTDMSGFLIAREAATGLVLAKIPLGAPSWTGVSIAGGMVFTGTGSQGDTGYLVAYAPRTGNEGNEGEEHWDDSPPPDADRIERTKGQKKKCKKGKRRGGARAADHPAHDHQHGSGGKKKCKKGKKKGGSGEQGGGHGGHSHEGGPGGGPSKPIRRRGDRYVPKPAGTTERLKLYYGPYTVPPGWDANRVDLELPMRKGFLLSVNPAMARTLDSSEPTHREAHIHHAHWFRADPGNKEDQYFRGNAEWIFGNGDEETKGDFRPRSAADPDGPIYGQYIGAHEPSPVIYMLHNKTAQPLSIYIVLDVTYLHGTAAEIKEATGREAHDVRGILFGKTFDIPREPEGDGRYTYNDGGNVIEFTSNVDGTIVGMGGHLHPGGRSVIVENHGSEESPCADTNRWGGGTLLLKSDARFVNAPNSEDFQMEVTHPYFRAPIRKGDRIRINGVYVNKDNAWYDVMTHLGIYVDEQQSPKGHCKPKLLRKNGKKLAWKTTRGVMNRDWDSHEGADVCGAAFGGPPCEKPDDGPEPPEIRTSTVQIANFAYLPGDRSASGGIEGIPTIKRGEQLTFVNEDQAANIRHTVTTCPWPCNGKYVSNYPLPDGAWDSGTMGYDPIDQGSAVPFSRTPPELPAGTYSYFCRIHPWMRGAFKVTE